MYNVIVGKVLKQGFMTSDYSRRVFAKGFKFREFSPVLQKDSMENNMLEFGNVGQISLPKNLMVFDVVPKNSLKVLQWAVSQIAKLVMKKLPPNIMETLKNNPVELLKYIEKFIIKQLTKRILKDSLSELDLSKTDDLSKQFDDISTEVANEVSFAMQKVTHKYKFNKVVDDVALETINDLKSSILKNTKEILTLSNEDLLELYATGLKANQKECLIRLFSKIRKNELSPNEFNQFLDIVTANEKIKTEEVEDLHKSIVNIKNTIADINKKKPQSNVTEIDVALVHRLKDSHNVSDEVCGSCYTFLTKVEKEKLSDFDRKIIYNILFGDKSQNMPSIFNSLGITENKNCFKNLSKLLDLKDNMNIRMIIKEYHSGDIVIEAGFIEKVIDYFDAGSVNGLAEKMKRSPIDIECNLSDIHIKQIRPGIHLKGTEKIKIDKDTIRHMPQKYIDNINRGEYDIKFLTPAETRDSLMKKYGGNNGSNIVGVQKGRTYDVEIRINGGNTGDRLLGTYDPKTGIISFDVFSQGGLHSNNTEPSQFFGPKVYSYGYPKGLNKSGFMDNPVKFCLALLSNSGLLFYNQKKDKEWVNEVHYQKRGFI